MTDGSAANLSAPHPPPTRRGRRPLLRKAGRCVSVAIIAALLCVVPTAAFIGVTCYRPVDQERSIEASAQPGDLAGYRRAEAFTYLTLPEWFIVYSADEYATFIQHETPAAFPYLGSIAQYWGYYASACRATRSEHPFELGYHVMLGVIGISFTVENSLKALYEHTMGWLSERLSGRDTAEDAFAAQTAVEYGVFMHTVPWYRFPFTQKLTELWVDVPLVGPHLGRKLERRLVLTAEYLVKGTYGWVIGKASGSAYEPEDLTIQARVDHVTASVLRGTPIEPVQSTGDDAYVVRFPRYEAFTAAALTLLDRGGRFLDIAGNDEILVSVLAPTSIDVDTQWVGHVVARRPILTDAQHARVAVSIPVARLHTAIPAIRSMGGVIEHLYDY